MIFNPQPPISNRIYAFRSADLTQQLWDVCSDQEAVDLIRNTQDPQLASKNLVDHALSRYSTDNLSCMVVRFDSKALQQTLERQKEPIGVEGDPASTKKGGMSETDAKIQEARKGMPDVDVVPSEVAVQTEDKSIPTPEVIKEEEEKDPGSDVHEPKVQNITEEPPKTESK